MNILKYVRSLKRLRNPLKRRRDSSLIWGMRTRLWSIYLFQMIQRICVAPTGYKIVCLINKYSTSYSSDSTQCFHFELLQNWWWLFAKILSTITFTKRLDHIQFIDFIFGTYTPIEISNLVVYRSLKFDKLFKILLLRWFEKTSCTQLICTLRNFMDLRPIRWTNRCLIILASGPHKPKTNSIDFVIAALTIL